MNSSSPPETSSKVHSSASPSSWPAGNKLSFGDVINYVILNSPLPETPARSASIFRTPPDSARRNRRRTARRRSGAAGRTRRSSAPPAPPLTVNIDATALAKAMGVQGPFARSFDCTRTGVFSAHCTESYVVPATERHIIEYVSHHCMMSVGSKFSLSLQAAVSTSYPVSNYGISVTDQTGAYILSVGAILSGARTPCTNLSENRCPARRIDPIVGLTNSMYSYPKNPGLYGRHCWVGCIASACQKTPHFSKQSA